MADVLHAEVVLVGEEVRQPVVDDVLAEHRPRGRGPPVQRVRPLAVEWAGSEAAKRRVAHDLHGAREDGAMPLKSAGTDKG